MSAGYKLLKYGMTTDESQVIFLMQEVSRLRERLNTLTPSLSIMLRRRGFSIYKKEPQTDLILPDQHYVDSYYGRLKKYSFRLFLREVIKHQPLFDLAQVARFATNEVTVEYLHFLESIGLIASDADKYRLLKGPIKSFGPTLEWFVAEIFRREFSAEAIWGAKMKHRNVGGDYDLLSRIEGAIIYMEIKSSPPRQIYPNEISAFLSRVLDLSPEVAVFFMDTELRMKDKIVPMFEEELKSRFASPPGVRRMERELFEVSGEGVDGNKIFIINAKDSVAANIEKVLIRYLRGGH